MPNPVLSEIQRAMVQVPTGLFVLSAQFEGKRAGVVVRSVQACADAPPLLCVAIRRGQWIEPVIRDSHAFAISRVSPADRLLLRKFAESARPRDGDPFDYMPWQKLVTGSPVIARSSLALDCEVVRHFDLEADHELYIGLVVAARVGPGPNLDAAGQQSLSLDLKRDGDLRSDAQSQPTQHDQVRPPLPS